MEDERQATNIRLKCGSCGQPVSSCLCAGGQTVSMGSSPGLSQPIVGGSVEQPHLVSAASDVGAIVGGKYQLTAELGSGGMGTVFKAKHIGLPKHFAVKILKAEFSNNADFRARFEHEANTVSLLNHPHLVSTYDYGSTEFGEAYLVMDFLDGSSLDEALKTIRRLEQRTAVKIFAQICEALTHAHGLGILHRDLKPSNVMLINSAETSDFVKVVDFGVAKIIATGNNVAQITQSMTKTGQFFGSPLYMSPEQCNGGKVDQRSDIYAMGVLMYECLTSDVPFRGDNFFATMVKHTEAQPKPFDPALGISPDLEKIVRKALEKNPEDRYQSMEQLRLALSSVFEGDKRPSRSKTQPQLGSISKARAAVISGSILLLCAAGWSAYHLTGNKAPTRQETASLAPAIKQSSSQDAVPPSPASAIVLPTIPGSVQMPARDKNMTTIELADAGATLARAHNYDWKDLLPARYFTTAIQRDQQYSPAYANLADYYWQQAEKAPEDEKAAIRQKCLQTYSAWIALNPKNPQLYVLRSVVYTAMHRQVEALQDTSMAIKLSPLDHAAHLAHAQCLNELHQHKEAIPEFEQYCTDNDLDYLYPMGACYQALHQDQTALDFASRWLSAHGPDVGLMLVKADSEFHLKQYQKALTDYKALKPLWPDVLTSRGSEMRTCRQALPGNDK